MKCKGDARFRTESRLGRNLEFIEFFLGARVEKISRALLILATNLLDQRKKGASA